MSAVAENLKALTAIGPCDLCPWLRRCSKELLACEAFEQFAHRGGRAWRTAPRQPSAEILARVFKREKDEKPKKVTRPVVQRPPVSERQERLNAFMLSD